MVFWTATGADGDIILKLQQEQMEIIFCNCSKTTWRQYFETEARPKRGCILWRWYFGTAERADGDDILKTAARANGEGIF